MSYVFLNLLNELVVEVLLLPTVLLLVIYWGSSIGEQLTADLT